MKKILIGLSLAILLAACASKEPMKEAKVDERTPTPTTAVSPTATTQGTGTTSTAIKGDDLKNPNSILSKRVIYFEYDQDTVKSEYAALIQAHANYLANNRGRKIRLEGYADERGSREYNMALGQRRADAVRKAASVLGVSNDRMETISFGEDKPKAMGHDESAWAQNRRVEIVYDGE